LLWADNVSFRYAAGAPLVVDGVTVRLTDGALAGILGPNGSGKTTLLRLLSGTRRPTSGRVLLGDRPLAQLSRREAARQIAVVPQETELAFEYRAIEIVLMGRTRISAFSRSRVRTTSVSRRRRSPPPARVTSPSGCFTN
jgi:iron complex transport system ATP-binding protein